MTTEHPITPSAEWIASCWKEYITNQAAFSELIIRTARWGADQELEACCEWLQVWFWQHEDLPKKLRTARRPKPPSLKEQALQALYRFDDTEGHDGLTQEQIAEDFVIIRRALESLPS